MKVEKKYVGVGIDFKIDVKSLTHSCADQHQTWALGISWVRWWTVSTRKASHLLKANSYSLN